ncbi:hypothetical protein EYF80_014131 [Liparis tanakae]|uniref:Uncharacterized protein n=1 Tax=Liparis tanakae TaxID=230148 RepID=A0A4Z2ICR4_9TELE|nr:hypothetical protein EYF80_014131 [Liparis tanakae]
MEERNRGDGAEKRGRECWESVKENMGGEKGMRNGEVGKAWERSAPDRPRPCDRHHLNTEQRGVATASMLGVATASMLGRVLSFEVTALTICN